MKNHIKELRVRENLTQADLAGKANVRRETVVFLEQNKYNPSLRLAIDIAKALNCHLDEVFDLD